jgi:hypothetical protein
VLNWSFILKYLLGQSSNLKKKLQEERKQAQHEHYHHHSFDHNQDDDRSKHTLNSVNSNNTLNSSQAPLANIVPFAAAAGIPVGPPTTAKRNGRLGGTPPIATSPLLTANAVGTPAVSNRQGNSNPISAASSRPAGIAATSPAETNFVRVPPASSAPRPPPAPTAANAPTAAKPADDDDFDDLISEIAAGANAVKGMESLLMSTSPVPGAVAVSGGSDNMSRISRSSKFTTNSKQSRQGQSQAPVQAQQSRDDADDNYQSESYGYSAGINNYRGGYSGNASASANTANNMNAAAHMNSFGDDYDRHSVDETSDLTFTNATFASEQQRIYMNSIRQQEQQTPHSPMSQISTGSSVNRVGVYNVGTAIGRPKYLQPVTGYGNIVGKQNSGDSVGSSAVGNSNNMAGDSFQRRVDSRNSNASAAKSITNKSVASNRSSNSRDAGNGQEVVKQIVTNLGVDKSQEAAAMSIVDRVTKITYKQLSLLDPETRAQVMQIRQELGLDPLPPQNTSGSTVASSVQSGSISEIRAAAGGDTNNSVRVSESGRTRASSAPRLRAGQQPPQQPVFANSNAKPPMVARSADLGPHVARAGGSIGDRGYVDDNKVLYTTPKPPTSNSSHQSNRSNSNAVNNSRRAGEIPVVEVDFAASMRRSANLDNTAAEDNNEYDRARIMAESRRMQRNGDARYLDRYTAYDDDESRASSYIYGGNNSSNAGNRPSGNSSGGGGNNAGSTKPQRRVKGNNAGHRYQDSDNNDYSPVDDFDGRR